MGRLAQDEPQDQPLPDFAVIKARDDLPGQYDLYSQVGKLEPEFRQTLEFDGPSQTLVNLDGDRERCIAFWNRKSRKPGVKTNSIFAKRVKTDDEDPAFAEQSLLPWEKGDDGGTWGAEDG